MSHQESIAPEQQQQQAEDLEARIRDPEVVPKAKRRQVTAEYKLRILEEADRCTEPGQIGALLRREGLYSSHLSKWRQLRERWQREGLAPQKRGRTPQGPRAAELAQLQRENERLRAQLEQAYHYDIIRATETRELGKLGSGQALTKSMGEQAAEQLIRHFYSPEAGRLSISGRQLL